MNLLKQGMVLATSSNELKIERKRGDENKGIE
jgi:hypothetical protein